MTEGFDLDEIERLLDEGLCDPENLCEEGFAITAGIIDQVPAMIAELRELRAENARLRQTGAFLLARLDELEWQDGALEETAREYFGHVDPAIHHFRAALGEPQ